MGTFHTFTCSVFLKRTDSATQGKQGPGAHDVNMPHFEISLRLETFSIIFGNNTTR